MARQKQKDREGRAGDRDRRRGMGAGGDLLEGHRHADLVVAGLFLALTLVLFADFIFSDGMLYGSDTVPSGIFFRGFYRDFVRAFVAMPMWDPYILGGLPFVDAMHGDIFYPASILQFFLPLHRALGYKLVLHVFLAGVGIYFFLRVFGLRRASSAFGGLCYMFAPTFVTFVFAGHDAKMYVIALLPYQFYCLERGFQSRSLRPFLMLGGVTGLSILSSHNQMAYFSLWGVGLYFLFRLYLLLHDWRADGREGIGAEPYGGVGRVAGFFGIALVVALAVGAVQLAPAYVYVQNYSVRGTAEKTSFEHATSFSLHPEEIASLIVPEFVGYRDKAGDMYWGRNFFKLNSEYAGIFPLIFAFLSLAFRRDRRVWFFWGGGALALIYAVTYHTPFFRLCYEFIPGVKNFRSQGMIAFLYAFCACTLGAIGLNHVLDRAEDARDERLYRGLRILGGVVLAAGVIGVVFTKPCLDLWVGLIYSDITQENRQVLGAAYPEIQKGVMIFMALGLAGLAVAWTRGRKHISANLTVLMLGGLVLVDTWRIDRRFIHVVDHDMLPGFRRNEVISALQRHRAQEGPFRVLDLSRLHSPNELGAHRVETVGGGSGFHDNELRWHRQFRGENDGRLLGGLSIGPDGQLKGVEANSFLNLLNVRYVIYRRDANSPVQIYENRGCLSRAFVASNHQVVGSPDRIFERLESQNTNPGNTVLLEEDPGWGDTKGGDGAAGTVQGVHYEGDQIEVRVRMNRRGILVLADNYFPYWKATDNGKRVPVVRAYATIRALCLDAGDHLVQFTYVSRPYQVAKWITILSVLAVVLVVKDEWVRRFLKKGVIFITNLKRR